MNCWEKTVDKKVVNLEKVVDGKLESTARIKPPCFNSSSLLSVFKFQFEIAASKNGWDDDEKALELILALKAAAAGILETIPTSRRYNYNELMLALHRKFGDEHKRELYRM